MCLYCSVLCDNQIMILFFIKCNRLDFISPLHQVLCLRIQRRMIPFLKELTVGHRDMDEQLEHSMCGKSSSTGVFTEWLTGGVPESTPWCCHNACGKDSASGHAHLSQKSALLRSLLAQFHLHSDYFFTLPSQGFPINVVFTYPMPQIHWTK